jgi:hypothetical protein
LKCRDNLKQYKNKHKIELREKQYKNKHKRQHMYIELWDSGLFGVQLRQDSGLFGVQLRQDSGLFGVLV